MCSDVSQGSVIDPVLFLETQNALEALWLLSADDVEMVTPRTQAKNLQSSLISPWDWSNKKVQKVRTGNVFSPSAQCNEAAN